MLKVYFINTFSNNQIDVTELEDMSNEQFKEKAKSTEYADFDQAFEDTLDQAYLHGKAILENTKTGQTYIMDDDSDEVQTLKIARNRPDVNFKEALEGVKADSKKFARAFLQ